jgi:hypothetical protein
MSGFSISIAPPHFEHFVRAFGRSPSLDSSNLNLDWQLGQTTIIGTHLLSARRAAAGAFHVPGRQERIIRIRWTRQRDKMGASVRPAQLQPDRPVNGRGGDVERDEILWFDGDEEDIEDDDVEDDEDFDEDEAGDDGDGGEEDDFADDEDEDLDDDDEDDDDEDEDEDEDEDDEEDEEDEDGWDGDDDEDEDVDDDDEDEDFEDDEDLDEDDEDDEEEDEAS